MTLIGISVPQNYYSRIAEPRVTNDFQLHRRSYDMVDRSRYLSKLTIPINFSKLVFHLFPSLSTNICRSKLKRGNSNVWGLIKIDLLRQSFYACICFLETFLPFTPKLENAEFPWMMIYKFYTLDSIELICKADNLKRRLCQQI